MKFNMSIFLKSICSLIFSQMLIKIFGLVYTLYITNKTGFGDKGNAIYMGGYQIYSLMLTVSSIGIPNAIAKLVAEKEVLRDYKGEKKVVYISSILFGIIAFLGSLVLYFNSTIVADYLLEIPEAEESIKMLSPAIFFVSMGAVLRGYFNGKNEFKIGAKTQVLEQILKTFLTIIFVEYISIKTSYDTKAMATAASFGTTISTIISFLYIAKMYYKEENIKVKLFYEGPSESSRYILRKIILFSFPITIGAILASLSKNIDSITIVRILKDLIGKEMALEKYGILSSKIDILIALPLSINSSVSQALIPAISERKVINDIEGVEAKIIEAIDLTFLITIPCAFGMMFYSKEIFYILFSNAKVGYELLMIASISIVFSSLVQVIGSVLQSLDKIFLPLIVSIIGIIIKFICNISLIRIEGIYEKGAVIGNVLMAISSYIIISNFLKRNIKLKTKIMKISYGYLISSIIMIILSKFLYSILNKNLINLRANILISIVFSVIFYGFCIFFIKKNQKNFLKKAKRQNVENTGF